MPDTTETLPITFGVDGTWHSATLDVADVTPDGRYVYFVAPRHDATEDPTARATYCLDTRPIAPPGDTCNGRTDDGDPCGLAANWGRSDPVETNVGRCRYHKDQPVASQTPSPTPDPTPDGGGYGEAGYGTGEYGSADG